ncbi:hypothetical protein KKG83_04895 [Candidatus Micrarchaeota archaeon]|nr:hypothetical protein [Candidatus Micrarchaeota archaeon]MBU2476782.1 hypothetical protein [Candidatus Micrarchaeota archaeon]
MISDLVESTDKIRKAFERNDLVKLRQLSNGLIEEAALKSDKVLAQLSLISYSLQKLLSKPHIIETQKWAEIRKTIIFSLNQASMHLKKKNFGEFKKELNGISEKVFEVDSSMGNYIANIYEKAKIKQASRAYALGLSLMQSVSLTGADEKELLNYIGATKIHDREKSIKGINERKKFLEGIFFE